MVWRSLSWYDMAAELYLKTAHHSCLFSKPRWEDEHMFNMLNLYETAIKHEAQNVSQPMPESNLFLSLSALSRPSLQSITIFCIVSTTANRSTLSLRSALYLLWCISQSFPCTVWLYSENTVYSQPVKKRIGGTHRHAAQTKTQG